MTFHRPELSASAALSRKLSYSSTKGSGFSLVELLAVMAIFGVTATLAGLTLFAVNDPLRSATFEAEAVLKQARVRAMASTSACRSISTDATTIVTECAPNCGAGDMDWVPQENLELTLLDDVQLADPGWLICFNSRGLANNSGAIDLTYTDHNSVTEDAQIGVLFGGAIWNSYSDTPIQLPQLGT